MNPFIDSLNLDYIDAPIGDMSARRYYRAHKNGRTSMLMVYPEVTEEALAEMRDFIRISEVLRDNGLKAPALYAVDEAHGTGQFEDLGDQSFGNLRRAGADMAPYYALGTDALRAVSHISAPDFVPAFKGGVVNARLSQFVEYYVPYAQNAPAKQEQRDEFYAAWDEMEAALAECPQTLQLMDAHLENMILCEDEEGVKRCGLIDYQDATIGPMPYDLVNLLEDARVDVDPALKAAMVERFCVGMSTQERDVFEAWYAVMALHFHSRVIGLFIQQAVENGNDSYLIHMPRMERYLREKMDHPTLAPIMDWYRAQGLDFDSGNAFDGEALREQFSHFVIPSEVEGS